MHNSHRINWFLALLPLLWLVAACEADPLTAPGGDDPATNDAPVTQIESPSDNASLWVEEYDASRSQWYIEVSFAGTASDPEDGVLDGASVVWRAQADGHPLEILGSGRNLTARLYSLQPFGTPYTITLEATDGAGATSTTAIQVVVNILS